MAIATKAAAKVAGKAKGAAKALAGYAKIFHHLAAEHAELSILMSRVSRTSEDSSVREELFPEIRRNLLAHAHAEEQEFYPVLRSFSELKTLVSQCTDEHKLIEGYLEELAALSAATTTWTTLFERMMNAVAKHVEREENELFPRASELLSSQQSKEMYQCYENVEEREKAALAAD